MSPAPARTRSAVGRLLVLVLALTSLGLVAAPASQASPSPPQPVVIGSRLVDARSGDDLEVAGVNRSGSEYACVQGWGLFDGPVDDQAIAAIAAWGTNVIRIPLNESCWLGLDGVRPELAAAAYRRAIGDLVDRAARHGLAAILDLHWASPGATPATHQEVAPNRDHTPAFWTSVASAYRTNPSVVFELYNEPRDISWACWRDGCTTPSGWRAAGAQELVDAVRATGARQPIVLDGLNWGGDLSQWSAHAPVDPLDGLVAGWHAYSFSGCRTPSCWEDTVAPVTADHPVLLTEVGQDGCATDFLETILPWADAHRVGYLAWSWNTASCSGGPSLITDYDGTPTAFGAGYRRHLDQRRASPQSPPVPAPSPPSSPPTSPAPDPAPARPVDPTAVFDFEDGTPHGWSTRWGSVGVSAGRGPASSGSGSLQLSLTGSGYPAVGVDRGVDRRIDGLGAGSTVGFRVHLPPSAGTSSGVGVAPVVLDAGWTATVLRHQTLRPGWNTVVFRVPETTEPPQVLGMQVDDPRGWRGVLSLDRVTVTRLRHTFEARTGHGWRATSGRATVRCTEAASREGRGSLGIGLPGGSRHALATTQVRDLVPGAVASISVWGPRGVRASVAPVVHHRTGAVLLPARQLSPGWNDLTVTVPEGDQAVTALGLRITTTGGWRGRLLLDSVAW
ncbi:Cellulase (glycosyl hydrolase family 5) [Nocardioides scoriae]|uniref:cellulase n=1 Tax=Nocardioides scoriae TaxID=642780 RepID=A0A1H1LKZ5_9ACTN|nr:cellulase family glycosylhydrolase [Nocardioides scoriae]SDR74715.1 Cellulase (glycosyl hydrolase family 5) [Nocardioides scoriae]